MVLLIRSCDYDYQQAMPQVRLPVFVVWCYVGVFIRFCPLFSLSPSSSPLNLLQLSTFHERKT
jgi:hypothetical protein